MKARAAVWLCLASAAAATVLACAKRGPRDVGNQNPRSEFAGGAGPGVERDASVDAARVVATPTPKGLKPRELAHVYSRALAVDAATIYFGDASDDTLCALDKNAPAGASAEPRRIARRAPVAGALAIDAHDLALAWIGSPGDVVLRVPVKGGVPTTIRDRGIFTDVAAAGGDVFISEAQGSGGILTRVTGTTAARLASFEGTPRGLVVDASTVYLATSTFLASTPRTRGDMTELARGGAFSSPLVDDTWLYATARYPNDRSRVVVRVKKSGGPLETLAIGVRDAPIALHRGTVYWFDADRPRLLSATTGDTPAPGRGAAHVVSDDALLDRPNAIAVDDDGAFVAAGTREDARIVVVSIR